MATEWELSIDVDAPAEVTWSMVGDPLGVPRWFPKYTDVTLDGDLRTLTNANGARLVERIFDWHGEDRRYSYSVIEGPPLAHHEASFQVLARPEDRSTVVWRTRAQYLDASIDPEERLAGSQREGLERLKAIIEGAI